MRQWMKKLRKERNLTQKDAAHILGISASTYAMIEMGERQKKMSVEMALKLAEVFGVTMEFICENENKANVYEQ